MVALKTLIFTIFIPGTVAGLLPWYLAQREGWQPDPFPSIWLLGLIPLLFGIVLYLWCAGAFTFIGKGTPAPIDAPVFLVREGPYQWVRNPMYIGVLSIILGEAIFYHSLSVLVYILVMISIVHLFIIFYEEPTLRRQFGESYENYLRTVPRWLPRPPRVKQT
jgi:protein-S-isoprenylcysteine O-methyltransferase Ste14